MHAVIVIVVVVVVVICHEIQIHVEVLYVLVIHHVGIAIIVLAGVHLTMKPSGSQRWAKTRGAAHRCDRIDRSRLLDALHNSLTCMLVGARPTKGGRAR